VNPVIEGYSAAIFQAESSIDSLASELRAIEGLVETHAALRLALIDTATPAAARRGVIQDLLAERVSVPARRLATFVAGSVGGPEIPAALAWLAVQARRQAEGQYSALESLSFLAARERVGGFAAAVYEDLSAAQLEEMEDELFRFARTVESAPALRSAFTDRDRPVDSRQGIAHDLLEAKVQAETLQLVDYAIAGGRARDFVGTLDWLVEATARVRGWRVARVRSAREVDADQRAELADSLTRLVGFPVELQVILDPSLLMGAVVRVGDLQVDATARGRLDALREHLIPAGWEPGPLGQSNDRRSGAEGAR
jgi:F-type H+-transporting ATPase subunit delta